MFEKSKAYCSFSVKDIKKARQFYSETLGLKVTEENIPGGGSMLTLHLAGGGDVLVYPKEDHVPATFTVLNFPVTKIDSAVKDLASKGVSFERYETTDDAGINHNEGPLIAWFKDPAGNFLSVIQEERLDVKDDLKIKRFIPADRDKVFAYWTTPEHLEKWCYPDGMSLKVPLFEARKGGKYRYEHTDMKGIYICTGYIKEFIPNEKITSVDTVKSPDGKIMFENLECETLFRDLRGGTEIFTVQRGFPDQESLKGCEGSWNQCLDNLSNLLSGGMGTRPDQKASDPRNNLHL